MSTSAHSARTLCSEEHSLLTISPHGRIRVAVGYPNTYHVAMSSLAFQWIVRLAASVPDVGVERFVSDGHLAGRTLEGEAPLGNFDVLAFTCSFEPDAVNLLNVLDATGIPRQWRQRDTHHPLIIVGGAMASINPLPMSEAVDIFVLGAAELLWPSLLSSIRDTPNRERLLADLAGKDGFFIPRHHLDSNGTPSGRRRRLEKRDRHMLDPEAVPASHIVTPHTEYKNRGLIEMSRGCPEKCSYCWVSHNYGRLRSYPTDAIMARVDELSRVTSRIGFVATAIGDHPDLAAILCECRERKLSVALSSLRIPAMVPEILGPLAASGTSSVTIAPETGSDALRSRLHKPITNERILDAVRMGQECGIPNLKMYFILGLPGETDTDVESIGALLRDSMEIMLHYGRDRGRMGSLHAGVSILVPKPYTPYHGESMVHAREARRRIRLLSASVRGINNLRIAYPSFSQALWQAFLSRSDAGAFSALEAAAAGGPLSRVLADHRAQVERATTAPQPAHPAWSFISSAPSGKPSPTT